ncbi:CxC2 domain-containing protein [Mycena chlorophos]|uniref:CxC2 domain-containing protein n=1 Tax=Mycena chlorophos TaxID=658473 RepID=A0A8H6W696_MYCCL|nr:CxC2 domain-containing protein [Mycena chlorophos]
MKKRQRRHSASVIDMGLFSLNDDFYLMELENNEVVEPIKKPIRPSDPALRRWAEQHRNEFLRALLWHDARGKDGSETCARCTVPGKAAAYRCDDFLFILFRNGTRRAAIFLERRSSRLVSVSKLATPLECPLPAARGRSWTNSPFYTQTGSTMLLWTTAAAKTAEAQYLQLLRSRLFPATVQRPQTCATFACLDLFNLFSLKPKVTAFDFYDTLEKLTNGLGDKPPDRYRMLLRMARMEASLASQARRAVRIRIQWGRACPPEHSPLVARLVLILGSTCPTTGRRQSLANMMLAILRSDPGSPICSSRALIGSTCGQRSTSKRLRGDGSGDGSVRAHEFVLPTGVGDLQRGERYANMDFIFASVLRHFHLMLRKVVSYDIVCQWYKHLFERLKELPPFLKAVLLRRLTRLVVPKLHILGHTAACKNKFDLNLVPGSGQTDAEGIERARSDMLDAYWSSWNWGKVLSLPSTLRQRLDAAKIELVKQTEAFNLFSDEQEELVPEWTEMVLAFEEDGSKKNPNIDWSIGESEAQVRLRLQQIEDQQAAEGRAPLRVHEVGPVAFLEFALSVEQQQRRIKTQAALKKSQSTAEQIHLGSSRRKLNRDQQTLALSKQRSRLMR